MNERGARTESESRREIGLFRYALVRDPADPALSMAERGRLVRAIAGREHVGPDGRLVRVARGTLDEWIRAYRHGGFEALVPQPRVVSLRTSAVMLDLAFSLKRERPERTAAQVREIMLASAGEGDYVPGLRTLQTHLARAGLNVRGDGRSPGKVYGRFEADVRNELWTGDGLHGPKLAGSAARRAVLLAFIDDHSRVLVGWRWGTGEDVFGLEAALRSGLMSRGVPEQILVDRGSAFVSSQLLRACAVMGVKLIHASPRAATTKGKIERFFRTVRDQFLVEVDDGIELTELNRLFSAWLEVVYHRRVHSETEQTPLVVCPTISRGLVVGWVMRSPTPPLLVTDEQRSVLEKLLRSRTAPHRDVQRARVLVLAADGLANTRIAGEVGVSAATVVNWRERFAQTGLRDFSAVRPGRGRKASIPAEKVEEIVRLTLHEKPVGETHWSCRTMAEATGVSSSTVQRVWAARGLRPHKIDTFKLSNDPRFEEKLVDVVGLYLNPPENAIVLCMDEKSQIQALDRTQASLPMKPGRAGTMTHDYKRNGTTTLFAALDVLSGVVIGQCLPRHRHSEFLKFLKTIDREVPKGLKVHLILDNYATHKHPNVQAWIAKHPRFELHFTPTSSSWLNMVETFFGQLTDKAIRRGVFRSVPDLITAIETYLGAHNENPKPFQWTASTDQILDKVRRGRVALEAITN